jgi:arsenate reductase
MTTYDPGMSIDQKHALKTASTRLHTEFGDHFGVETIERFLHTSYDQFAGRATIPNFLPLLAERWARQRLTALARVEGKITDTKPTVLFLCTHNAGRSQMALGYFNHLAGDQGVAWSGGSEPGNEINPAAIAVMAEIGIDITRDPLCRDGNTTPGYTTPVCSCWVPRAQRPCRPNAAKFA